MSPPEEMRTHEFENTALSHFGELYRTAAKVVHDRMETEDIVQETFLRAWKSFHRFEPGTNCRAWLYKILFRVIYRQRRRIHTTGLTADLESILAHPLIYEPPLPDRITDEEILRALEKVPSNFSSVLLLADVEELPYKEVARSLRIPLGTVMSRLSRGRKILRRGLESLASSRG